ncbi:MAG: prepilin-type N-terminal cleavage/methylation domain-containing protein, partial [Alteromonadales bacterium]|nr:prepilin-type N-terminal cleavage/methylation domain-containing protein [Alteromonadales bacterium]
MRCLSKNNRGFTLIELVVVIVILGILAVTAAPKFIDLTSNAKASVINAVKGSIDSIDNQVYAKAVILGIHN